MCLSLVIMATHRYYTLTIASNITEGCSANAWTRKSKQHSEIVIMRECKLLSRVAVVEKVNKKVFELIHINSLIVNCP